MKAKTNTSYDILVQCKAKFIANAILTSIKTSHRKCCITWLIGIQYVRNLHFSYSYVLSHGIANQMWVPALWDRPQEIDGLLVPSRKAYTLLTDHLITGYPLRFESAQEKWVKSNHPYK